MISNNDGISNYIEGDLNEVDEAIFANVNTSDAHFKQY